MKTLQVLLFLIITNYSFCDFHVRFNHLGYNPESPKKIIVMSDEDLTNTPWALSRNNTLITEGKLATSETSIGHHMPKPYNYTIDFTSLKDTGTYTFTISTTSVKFQVNTSLYSFIPSEILRYYRVQRSGTKTALDHPISHKGDASCPVFKKTDQANTSWKQDEKAKNVDMLGGWYDAGDYLKFTLTTAYSTYLMLLSYELNPQLYQNQKTYSDTDLNDLLDEAKWGLDYLMKTMPEGEFIIQVGSADDHKQGDRLPNHDALNGLRPAYSSFSPTQMGYTAAALALGSNVFNSIGKTKESGEYKEMAKKIFEAATYFDSPSWVEEGWEKFYFDQTIHDNMELAAIELYFLTNESHYLNKAKTYAQKAGSAYWYSWGSINMIAHNRLLNYSEEALLPLKTDMDYFKEIAKEENNLWGVPHKYTWSTLYSYFGVANSAMLMSLKDNKDYLPFAYNVLDYTLGKNNWGKAMVASEKIPNSVENIYSQIYWIKTKLFPTGAIAEGPGDKATHDRLKQYFKLPTETPFDEFNTDQAVFYDYEHDFQTMETTICGLADGLLFFTLIDLLEKK